MVVQSPPPVGQVCDVKEGLECHLKVKLLIRAQREVGFYTQKVKDKGNPMLNFLSEDVFKIN